MCHLTYNISIELRAKCVHTLPLGNGTNCQITKLRIQTNNQPSKTFLACWSFKMNGNKHYSRSTSLLEGWILPLYLLKTSDFNCKILQESSLLCSEKRNMVTEGRTCRLTYIARIFTKCKRFIIDKNLISKWPILTMRFIRLYYIMSFKGFFLSTWKQLSPMHYPDPYPKGLNVSHVHPFVPFSPGFFWNGIELGGGRKTWTEAFWWVTQPNRKRAQEKIQWPSARTSFPHTLNTPNYVTFTDTSS